MREGAEPRRLTRRRIMERALVWAGGAIAWPTLLAACRDRPPSEIATSARPEPGARGRLTLGLSADATTLDPHRATPGDQQILGGLYDRLLDLDSRLNVVPHLAASWAISADGRVYTLRLVEGVKFQDGADFDAEAVRVNVERVLDPHTNSTWRAELGSLVAVESTDRLTVVLRLARPYAPLLASLADRAGMMISPRAIGGDGSGLALEAAGSGPFRVAEWRKGDSLTVRRNPAYWRAGLPGVDELTYRVIDDATQRLTALRANQVQVIDQIAWQDIGEVERERALAKSRIAGLGFQYIGLQTASRPFGDKALRQAVAWALDRVAINKAVYANSGFPAQTPISPASWAHDPAVRVYEQDYARARQKLAAAGRPSGFSFSMLTVATPEAEQLAEGYRQQLDRVGITVDIEPLEFDRLLERVGDGEYEAVSLGWSGSPDPDGNLYPHFHSRGSLNYSLYRNAAVDDLLDRARIDVEPARRRPLYAEVTRLIAEEAPMIFTCFPSAVACWQPAVQGVAPTPGGLIRPETLRLGAMGP